MAQADIVLTVEQEPEILLTVTEAKLKPEQSKTVTPSYDAQTVLPDAGMTLGSVTVEPIPEPTDRMTITENGSYDVARIGGVDVEVPQGVFPEGTFEITENGTYDVGQYAATRVAVSNDPTKGFILSDYDMDGYPTKARLVGEWSSTPINFTTTSTAYAVLFTHIKELELPNTLTSIGYASFANYYELQKVHIPSSVVVNGNSFAEARKLKEFVVDGNLAIKHGAISGAVSLERFVVGGSVTEWDNPFIVNSAPYITRIPIMLYDFSNCASVFTLPIYYQLAHADGCVIRVPAALLEEWQTAPAWRDLQNVNFEGV